MTGDAGDLLRVLLEIGNLPLEFNTRARALAQRAVNAQGIGRVLWRDPLTETEIMKAVDRGGVHMTTATSLLPEIKGAKVSTETKQAVSETNEPKTETPAYTPPEIIMIPVVSSNVEAVGHDGDKTLRMKFKSGSAFFDYVGIDEGKFLCLVNSPSIGRAWKGVVGDVKGIKFEVSA